MTDRPETTRVNIYGREYSIRGEGDPAYIAEIAHFLDMRMRQMVENITMTSTAKVAILASLNITDELFTKKRQLEEAEDNQQAFLMALVKKIDETLEPEEDSLDDRIDNTQVELSSSDTTLSPVFQKSSLGSLGNSN